MFRIKILQRDFYNYLKINRTYLSNEFKSRMDTRLDIPVELQIHTISKTPRAIEVLNFVNKLSAAEDRHLDVCDILEKLRKTEEATIKLEPINYAVIKHFIDTDSIDDLQIVIQNPLKYGIFVDNFTACYLMQHLLKTQNYKAAAQIAIELWKQEQFNNELVVAFAIKSCYDYLKVHLQESKEDLGSDVSEKSADEVKVRVKFLRNPIKVDTFEEIFSKTILALSEECSADIKENLIILGQILGNQTNDVIEKYKHIAEANFHQDVLNLCLEIIKKNENSDKEILEFINNQLTKSPQRQQSFESILNDYIQQLVQKEELSLIENNKSNYEDWLNVYKDEFNKVVDKKNRIDRLKNVDDIVQGIADEKQKLWFFDMEEKIQLDIYRKKVYYPKRWFGKKKKPRTVDDGYIPPEIR